MLLAFLDLPVSDKGHEVTIKTIVPQLKHRFGVVDQAFRDNKNRNA